MGSTHYRRELVKLTTHLREVEASSVEWEKVANLRLRQLIQLDGVLSCMVRDISGLGKIIGVDVPDTDLPDAVLSVNGSGETSSFIRGKLSYVAQFTRCLVAEAKEVQSTLDSTLSIALEAAAISRPLLDLEDHDVDIDLTSFRLSPQAKTFDIEPSKRKSSTSLATSPDSSTGTQSKAVTTRGQSKQTLFSR
jgi:hypothetical protein